MPYDRLPEKHFRTEAWRAMKDAIEHRIAELRTDNDSFANTEQTTAATRGRIAELHELLALEKAPAEAPQASDVVRTRQSPADVPLRRYVDGL